MTRALVRAHWQTAGACTRKRNHMRNRKPERSWMAQQTLNISKSLPLDTTLPFKGCIWVLKSIVSACFPRELNITGKYPLPMFNVTVNCHHEGGLDVNFELVYILVNNLTFTFFYSNALFVRLLPVQSNAVLPSRAIASCPTSQDQ